ncbi:MAG: transglutaminase family protein, partial [Limisphaerales bacterium]
GRGGLVGFRAFERPPPCRMRLVRQLLLHAAIAAFRAVENRIPLVRCTNNGLTCWVDSHGRMHEVYFPDSPDIHAAGFKIAQVPLRNANQSAPTFYNRFGDLFGWACVLVTAGALLGFLLQVESVFRDHNLPRVPLLRKQRFAKREQPAPSV